jgi:hypothetical protein
VVSAGRIRRRQAPIGAAAAQAVERRPEHPGRRRRLPGRRRHLSGWHWWPAPNAIASRAYRNRHACQRFGTREQGCPAGAKGSTDLTHWRDALDDGVVLVTDARVRAITTNAQGLATGAEYVGPRRPGEAPARSSGDCRREHRGHPAAASQFGIRAVTRRTGELVGSRRQAPDEAPVRLGHRQLRRGPGELAWSAGAKLLRAPAPLPKCLRCNEAWCASTTPCRGSISEDSEMLRGRASLSAITSLIGVYASSR